MPAGGLCECFYKAISPCNVCEIEGEFRGAKFESIVTHSLKMSLYLKLNYKYVGFSIRHLDLIYIIFNVNELFVTFYLM